MDILDNSILDSLQDSLTEEQEENPTLHRIEDIAKISTPEEKLGNTNHTGVSNSTEERALILLGSGIQPESVAAALGVTASRISQLLSQEDFAIKVAELRYESLQKHNMRDTAYDSLEDKLLEKLEKNLTLMVKPDTILKAISTINGAKRRGQSTPDQASAHKNIVQLVLPVQIVQQFITNLDNQVIKAGDQELITMPSATLLSNLEKKQSEQSQKLKELSDNTIDITHDQESAT